MKNAKLTIVGAIILAVVMVSGCKPKPAATPMPYWISGFTTNADGTTNYGQLMTLPPAATATNNGISIP